MTQKEIIEKLRQSSAYAERRYRTRIVGIFGSYARGEQAKDSDLDVLVEPEEGATLFDLGGLNTYLEETLDCPVDLVSRRSLREEIASSVLRDLVAL